MTCHSPSIFISDNQEVKSILRNSRLTYGLLFRGNFNFTFIIWTELNRSSVLIKKSNNFEKYVSREFSGKGKIILKDGRDYTANFQIYQLNPGNLIGSLWLTKIDNRLNDVLNSTETFRFGGETEKGLKVSAEQCAVYSYTLNQHVPFLIARFLIHVLKVFTNNLENLEMEGTNLCFEVSILNYYSTSNFSVNTEIGEIRSFNRFSNEEIAIFNKAHFPGNTSSLQLKVKGEKSLEATREKIFKAVDKILELTSFALCTEHRWSYYKIYLNEFSDSQFIYYESESRLPILPNSHNNINESKIGDFLNKSYNNYTDQLNAKYNFTLALKWYLDSMALKYDVMKFISASTSLESILDSFSTESEAILPKKNFCELRKKIVMIIENEVKTRVPQGDMESMLHRLSDINRRSYRKKAQRLLESLDLLDNQTKESLQNIIVVRDRITHSGRFVDDHRGKRKVSNTYFELKSLLTKVFIKILVPDDVTFYQEYDKPWKIIE